MLSILVGAIVGLLVGLLLNTLEIWRKDRRDARLRKNGLPLPSDRIDPKYHWFFLVQGVLVGIVLSVVDLWG